MSALSPWVFEKCQPLARCDGELGQGVGAIIGRQERVGASPVKAVMSMIYIYIYIYIYAQRKRLRCNAFWFVHQLWVLPGVSVGIMCRVPPRRRRSAPSRPIQARCAALGGPAVSASSAVNSRRNTRGPSDRRPPHLRDREPHHAKRPAAGLHHTRRRHRQPGAHQGGQQADAEAVLLQRPFGSAIWAAGEHDQRAALLDFLLQPQ
jgi:hypothetical protein